MWLIPVSFAASAAQVPTTASPACTTTADPLHLRRAGVEVPAGWCYSRELPLRGIIAGDLLDEDGMPLAVGCAEPWDLDEGQPGTADVSFDAKRGVSVRFAKVALGVSYTRHAAMDSSLLTRISSSYQPSGRCLWEVAETRSHDVRLVEEALDAHLSSGIQTESTASGPGPFAGSTVEGSDSRGRSVSSHQNLLIAWTETPYGVTVARVPVGVEVTAGQASLTAPVTVTYDFRKQDPVDITVRLRQAPGSSQTADQLVSKVRVSASGLVPVDSDCSPDTTEALGPPEGQFHYLRGSLSKPGTCSVRFHIDSSTACGTHVIAVQDAATDTIRRYVVDVTCNMCSDVHSQSYGVMFTTPGGTGRAAAYAGSVARVSAVLEGSCGFTKVEGLDGTHDAGHIDATTVSAPIGIPRSIQIALPASEGRVDDWKFEAMVEGAGLRWCTDVVSLGDHQGGARDGVNSRFPLHECEH